MQARKRREVRDSPLGTCKPSWWGPRPLHRWVVRQTWLSYALTAGNLAAKARPEEKLAAKGVCSGLASVRVWTLLSMKAIYCSELEIEGDGLKTAGIR